MDILAPVTDYIRDSLLVSCGDLVIHDGTKTNRLPIGDSRKIPRVNYSGAYLEYQTPGTFLFDFEFDNFNPALVTITTAPTDILSMNLGYVKQEERYLICFHTYFQKDVAEAGQVRIALNKLSGTGEYVMYYDLTEVFAYHNLLANQYANFHGAIILQITVSGDLVMRLNGLCDIGSAVVDVKNAQLYATTFKKIYDEP